MDDKCLEVFKVIFIWLICIHWAAALHVLPGFMASGFNPDLEVESWHENEVYLKHGPVGRYVICLFKTIKTFLGNGTIIELQPIMYFDRIYSAILTITSRVGLYITLGYIFKIIQAIKSSALRYDEMLVQLNKYTEQNNLPRSTKAKLRNNYDFIFNKRYFIEKEILKTVSLPLRQQIMIHNTKQLVENSPFFENLPSFLILKIIAALSVELFLEGDVIYTNGEVAKYIFFITSGSAAFYTPSGKEVCHLVDGDYFGVVALVSDADRHGEIVALETTECYKYDEKRMCVYDKSHYFLLFSTCFRLGKSDFLKLAQSYPDLQQKVEALAIERIERVLMVEEREKHRKIFGYKSINQQQFPNDKNLTTQ